MRKALVLCAAVLAFVALALPAYADGRGAQTETVRFHKASSDGRLQLRGSGLRRAICEKYQGVQPGDLSMGLFR